MTAAELLTDRALAGHLQVRREQRPDGLYLVFFKRRGAQVEHECVFRLDDNTLTHVPADG